MKLSNALSWLGPAVLVIGCHSTRVNPGDACCTRIEAVDASPSTYFGTTITLHGKLVYNGYLYLSASTERGDAAAARTIEISVDEVARLVSPDKFFELDGSCVIVRGKFLAATEHSFETMGLLSEITRLNVLSDCSANSQ